jgi:hypothetical protein
VLSVSVNGVASRPVESKEARAREDAEGEEDEGEAAGIEESGGARKLLDEGDMWA